MEADAVNGGTPAAAVPRPAAGSKMSGGKEAACPGSRRRPWNFGARVFSLLSDATMGHFGDFRASPDKKLSFFFFFNLNI